MSDQVTVGPVGCFHPQLISSVPEPARRYLLHTITPGTPLSTKIELQMSGRIRLSPTGRWMPFHAEQRMSHEGFVWKASAGRLLRIVGEDRYLNGEGAMEWKLWGLIPVVNGAGPNITRAARGRFLAEAAVWLPGLLLPQQGTSWSQIDDETAEAVIEMTGAPFPLRFFIGPDGRLQKIAFNRWGNVGTDKGRWTEIPFGVTFAEEATFDGYRVPTQVTASWWFATDRQFDFFEAGITSAKFGDDRSQSRNSELPHEA